MAADHAMRRQFAAARRRSGIWIGFRPVMGGHGASGSFGARNPKYSIAWPPLSMPLRPNPRRIRRALLEWFDAHKRDLPWRRTRDPYAILVSEVMLQQTRVETAADYYIRFLERFPTVRALARASVGDVLSVWAGLGYYRRARMLQSAAEQIVERHRGEVPSDPELLRSLPGVGVYTAGAVASIAFDIPVPAIDGNVIRVLSRIFAFRGDPATASGRAGLAEIADSFLSLPGRPGAWTQALMELGATVCLPAVPHCKECPVARDCAAHQRGEERAIPAPKRRRPTETVSHAAAVVERAGRLLFVRRVDDAVNGGLLEFPTVESPQSGSVRPVLSSLVSELCGRKAALRGPRFTVSHSITHRRIEVGAWTASLPARGPLPGLWLLPEEASLKGVTAATRKILAALARGGHAPAARVWRPTKRAANRRNALRGRPSPCAEH
jgi:A/G-specific adenine glycosylase